MKPRKKKAKRKYPEAIAVGWYTPEQWELLRQSAADRESMESTYEQWLAHAEDAVRILTQSGYRVRTVDIDVAELIAWCKRRNRRIDSEARGEFVEEKMEEMTSRKKPSE